MEDKTNVVIWWMWEKFVTGERCDWPSVEAPLRREGPESGRFRSCHFPIIITAMHTLGLSRETISVWRQAIGTNGPGIKQTDTWLWPTWVSFRVFSPVVWGPERKKETRRHWLCLTRIYCSCLIQCSLLAKQKDTFSHPRYLICTRSLKCYVPLFYCSPLVSSSSKVPIIFHFNCFLGELWLTVYPCKISAKYVAVRSHWALALTRCS